MRATFSHVDRQLTSDGTHPAPSFGIEQNLVVFGFGSVWPLDTSTTVSRPRFDIVPIPA
jgi:hypothetical protein